MVEPDGEGTAILVGLGRDGVAVTEAFEHRSAFERAAERDFVEAAFIIP